MLLVVSLFHCQLPSVYRNNDIMNHRNHTDNVANIDICNRHVNSIVNHIDSNLNGGG